MAGSMEGKFLAEALKGNALNLEEANEKIENSTNPKEKEKAFERAEKIETELKKIEEMMGIDAEEMLALYKTITPEDARSIVTMTIAKIPSSLMKGVLFTVDNLDKVGGKIMLISSMRFPLEAALIAAAIMALVVAEGSVQEAVANEIGSPNVELTETQDNAAQKSLEELQDKVVQVINTNMRKGLMQMNSNGKLEPMQVINGEPANQENIDKHPGVTVHGKSTRVIGVGENGEEILGNDYSIRKRGTDGSVDVGNIDIKK